MHMHLGIKISICKPLCLYSAKHEFILVSPTLIHYRVDHFSLLPFFVWNLPPQQWENWLPPSAIHRNIYSQCTCIVISALLTHLPWRTTLSSRGQCLRAAPAALSLIDSTHFQGHRGQHLLSPPASLRVSHTFVRQLDSFVTVCIPPWTPWPP